METGILQTITLSLLKLLIKWQYGLVLLEQALFLVHILQRETSKQENIYVLYVTIL